MSVYRVLCGVSYIGVLTTLLLGAAAVGALNAAWRLRRPGVEWIEGPGALALFRPSLFRPEGQPARRRAVRLLVASLIVMALTGTLALSLATRRDASACWVSSATRPATVR